MKMTARSFSLMGLVMVLNLVNSTAFAQKNCNNHTTGLVPLKDLSGKSYRGFKGGIYTDGNSRPALQLSRAISQAKSIRPLDTSGAENSKNGKIIFAAVGASNPATEFNKLIAHCDTFKGINPKVRLFNTCIGGTGIQKMNETTDNYWIQANKKLVDSGYSAKQVQVVWVEQENTQNADTSFPGAAYGLMADYQKLLAVIKLKFPNVKIIYLNQRAFAGYVDVTPGVIGKGLHFPRDYYNGWCIKWLIEKQINDEAGYKFPSELPFIDWATTFWADGKNKRSDGLSYDCTTDFGGDGLHLSALGEQKAGELLFNYYKTDTVSKYWFYKPSSSGQVQEQSLDPVISVYPNPAQTEFVIKTNNPCSIMVSNLQGQIVYMSNSAKSEHNIDASQWPKHLYVLNIKFSDGGELNKKIMLR